MKPKDLKSVFTFEGRCPLFKDGVFYVPIHYERHHEFKFPSLNDYFGNQNSHCIEYCSGNGDWIIEKALHEPDKNWIAVEKRFDRVRKIWSKMRNRSISNVLIVCGEALTFTKHYLQVNALDHVYINFPDPWPKMKHAKNRLIQKEFLGELERVLKQQSGLTIVTDDGAYLKWILKELTAREQLIADFPDPFFTTHLPNYGTSWFENLWRQKGKEIHYTRFVVK